MRIAMALKKLSYTHVSVGHIGWEAFREINPQGLMPALEVDGHIIQQATAILEWLEETHPERPLLPSDPILRAQARGFAQHIVSEMHAIDGLDKLAIDKWQRHWFQRGFAALEEQLLRRGTQWRFCYGETPGWADIHSIPQVQKGLT